MTETLFRQVYVAFGYSPGGTDQPDARYGGRTLYLQRSTLRAGWELAVAKLNGAPLIAVDRVEVVEELPIREVFVMGVNGRVQALRLAR